jgi:hypothetical protein
MKIWLGAAAALLLLTTATAAGAATQKFTATLKGGDETPPTDSKATGTVTATLDTTTKAFAYKVTYSGLSGPATAAHFHGPAFAGASAPPQVPVRSKALASPMQGKATLTDDQVKQLEGGQWYFNIHTAAHAGGEIRGQLAKSK